MTLIEARAKLARLERSLNIHDPELRELVEVVRFLFDNLDGRGSLDHVAWGSETKPPR